jgi:hypothetical protein
METKSLSLHACIFPCFCCLFFSFLSIIPLNSASNTLSKQEGLLDNGIAQTITKITCSTYLIPNSKFQVNYLLHPWSLLNLTRYKLASQSLNRNEYISWRLSIINVLTIYHGIFYIIIQCFVHACYMFRYISFIYMFSNTINHQYTMETKSLSIINISVHAC